MSDTKKYIIRPAVTSRYKQLTPAQRASSLFAEAPVIAGKIIRRGTEIVLTEAQYLVQKSKIEAFVKAGSITVTVVSDHGKVSGGVETSIKTPLTIPSVGVKVTPPEDGPLAPGVASGVVDLVADVASDVTTAVVPEVSTLVNAGIKVAEGVVQDSISPEPKKAKSKGK